MWGPDPDLTQLGLDQAKAAREAWTTEHAFGIPLPERHYASPLQRALRTFHGTFVGAEFLEGTPLRCTILEVSPLSLSWGLHFALTSIHEVPTRGERRTYV